MSDKVEPLKGAEKAAVFLLGVGEKSAASILKHMPPKIVQTVGATMASLRTVSRQQAEEVLSQFTESLGDATALSGDNEEFVRTVLLEALGKDKADGIINSVIMGRDSKGVESLRWMDSRAVAAMIRDEHPQIIAIILAYLDNEHSAEVMKYLSDATRKEAMIRLAKLDSIHPSALVELDEILEKQFSEKDVAQGSAVGGVQTAADILSFAETELESELIEAISAVDQDMGDKIRDLMFVFDNLLDVDDRGIQRLLRDVSSETLVIALKGAEEKVRRKIFGNMSKRAAEMMEEDLETRGPVRLSEVEEAQKDILAVAQRLAEEGEIMLGGPGGDEFV